MIEREKEIVHSSWKWESEGSWREDWLHLPDAALIARITRDRPFKLQHQRFSATIIDEDQTWEEDQCMVIKQTVIVTEREHTLHDRWRKKDWSDEEKKWETAALRFSCSPIVIIVELPPFHFVDRNRVEEVLPLCYRLPDDYRFPRVGPVSLRYLTCEYRFNKMDWDVT